MSEVKQSSTEENPEDLESKNLEDQIELVPPNYTVGELYIRGRTQYRNDVKAAFFTNSGQFLESFVWMPPKKYVKSFAEGNIEYGVYSKEGILLFLYKHAGGEWNVCPFNLCQVPETHRGHLGTGDDGRLDIKGVLVDGRSGKVKASRSWRLNKDVARVLVEGAKLQLEQESSEELISGNYSQRVNMLMRNGTDHIVRNLTAKGVLKRRKSAV